MKVARFETKRVGLVLGSVLVAMAGGCASQQAYDQLSDAHRVLNSQYADLKRQNQDLSNENSLLQRQRTANETALAELTRQNDLLKQQLSASGMSLDELQRRLAGLSLTPLDPETDRALTALASQYPDLIKYDSAKGMLRFAADLTFDSGQDVVKEEAKSSLAALAKVLTGVSASPYEVFIVGHTDSQPVSAATRQRGHQSNMHLSCHRAIAVRSALIGMGVPETKAYAAGWGEQRPIVPNGPRGNTPQNRRVEIYLTRATSASESAEPSTPATPDRTAAPTRQPDINK
ncbi:MAG: OmpA family protein [Phycisphaerae bacterium]|nr:OmpA family protein [Phycisphaerae bacterium]